MIKEAYVSFEIAKLLKEKGFNEPCRAVYEEEILRINTLCDYYNSELSSYVCAPTHQMAMKWLRKKGIYIYIQPTKYVGGALYGFQSIIEDGRNDDWKRHIHHEDNYEEAVEAALKYCLENLI